MSGRINSVLLGSVCGAVAGLIAGSLYAVLTQALSFIQAGLIGLLFGTVRGGLFGFRYHSAAQAASTRLWAKRFLFLGLIVTAPQSCMLTLPTLFGLAGVSEYQPVSDFILAIGLFVLAGGGSGAVGGLVGGYLFNQFADIGPS